jgi:hypothetical protein
MHGTRPLKGCLQGCYGACRGGVMQHAGYELPRITIPRTTVNKGKRKGWVLRDPALLITSSDLLLVGRLPQACGLLRLARSLASICEWHAGERFSPLLEEALVCFVALLKDLKDPARKILVGLRLTLNAPR